MVHWFMKRMGALLFAAPVMALIFVLLNTTGSTQSSKLEEDSDGDNMNDAYELFYGLNSTNPADGLLDYDGDALTNLAESVKLTDPFYEDTDRDGFNDDKDDQISRAYIQWGNPQFTAGDQYEYAHPDWFLGAYKDGGEWVVDLTTTQSCWYVSAYGSNGVGSLCVDLDRTILTNNLRYAIHYLSSIVRHGETTEDSVGNNSSLYVDLLDTNGVVVVENLYGSLISGSNVDATILLEIPTAKFPDAAVIQLRSGNVGAPPCPAVASERRRIVGDRSEDGPTEIFVYEGLLYIDEDGDGLDADQERQLGTSDYAVDSNGDGTNDYDECFNSGSSTNSPDGEGGGNGGGGDGGEDGEDDHDGHKKQIVYVDQAIGNDQFTGRSSAISANKKGPKKTVRSGLSITETNDTIIIRSGNYNENLDIRGKDVKVFIEGKVRL